MRMEQARDNVPNVHRQREKETERQRDGDGLALSPRPPDFRIFGESRPVGGRRDRDASAVWTDVYVT